MGTCFVDSTGLAAPPAESVEALASGIREAAANLDDGTPEIAARLRKISGSIRQEQVTINFGGVFKAGKSTMMNAVVGRNILPVDDVPETGAICCLLAGEQDTAAVVEGGIRRPIPCTTEAIRAEITLLSAQGDRRSEVAAIERAEIVLKDCIIPRNACWVDSPGYNDSAEMDERTRRSAAYADVLVWVLTSRQLLSQVEMEFLSNHLRESGPASVIFVLNGFLRRDTPEEWEQFVAKSAPQLINKVNHFSADMGFVEEAPPVILPVAGRAMCAAGQDSFGGSALLRFMTSVDAGSHPRVIRTRLWRASAGLRECAARLDEPAAQKADELTKLKKEVEDANRLVERKRSLAESLAGTVDQFLEAFASGAHAGSASLSARITDLSATSGSVGAAWWNQSIAAVAEAAGRNMIARAEDILRSRGEAPMGREWQQYFSSLSRPPAVGLRFPQRLESGGVDAFIETIPALLGEKLGHPPHWLVAVRLEIQRATNAVIQAMQSRRAQFMDGFDRLYSLKSVELPAPDESVLRRLEQARERLRELSAEASRLAMPTAPRTSARGWKQGLAE
jgi:predicted GTPase